MKSEVKKVLRTLGLAAAAAVFGGGALLIFALFAMLSGIPLYVTYAVVAVGISALAAAVAAGSGYLGRRGRRWAGGALACVCLLAAGYAGLGYYRDQLPTVDDRALLLWQYEPFAEDSRIATLPEPSALRFTSSERLRLDGATALYPVYAAFVQAVYPPPSEPHVYPPYNSMVECNGTVDAYERLINQEVDLIFAAAPSQAQLDRAARAGIELHPTPIGKEAFVFFVNSKNPVTGLTVEEIQKIYTGELTNWKELGGKNRSIRPFQRAEDSGSQSALERLMDGLPLLEPEQEDRVSAMDGIIRQVASYRNYQNAIGFSFRYYATEMAANDQIRLLALNGVEPTKETIRDGTYPISSDFYAVTASPAGQPDPRQENPKICAFLDWILSPQGQLLIEQTGYVALS